MKKMNISHNSKHFLNVLLLILMLVGISTNVWGVSTATLSAKNNRVQNDGITFSLSGSYIINNPLVDYTYTGSGNEATLSWAAPQGYSINVSQITIYAKNARSFGTTGKGQYKTSKNSSYTQFCHKNSFDTYTLNSSSYFGLGDNGTITIKAVDKELQYKDIVFSYTKTAHKYSIAFNGNTNTSGSTASVNATYDVNASLTANGFVKTKYTVRFDADGGTCGTSSTQINYVFAGWAETSTGSVKYANGATVKNLTATNNATVTLYAKWNNPASETITLPNAAKDGYVLEGWYDGSTKVGEAGNSYTVTKDVTLIAHWTQRFDFTMSGANTTLSVGEQQATAFNFVHASNPTPHITVTTIDPINNGNGKVIEYDAANNKIIAHNAGTATIYFAQAETSTIKSGTSAIYTYTVSKHQTSFEGSAYNLMVDGTQTADYSYTNTSAAQPTASSSDDFYYTIDEVSFTNEELNKGTDLITFNPSDKLITACNAGTAKITLHQKETYKYTGAEESFDVSVSKYTPSFTWNLAGKTYYYQSTIPSIFSTTGPNAYTIVSDNEASAKVVDNILHIYNVEETANITVTQEENYLWAGDTATYVVTPVELNNHVEFNITSENINIFKYGTSSNASLDGNGYKLGDGGLDKTVCEYSIQFTGIPEYLSFDKHMDNYLGQLPVGSESVVYESADGTNWIEVWKNTERKADVNGTNILLKPTTRYLKFYYNGSIYCYYQNIHITELNQFSAAPVRVDFGTKGANYGTQEENVTFNHANAGRVTTMEIVGDDAEYFSIERSSIPGTGRDLYSTFTIAVRFDNRGEVRGEDPYVAVLHIVDNKDHILNIPLTGIRNGKTAPEFSFNPNHLPYFVGTNIANVASSTNTDYANCPLTFETNDASVAEVIDGTLRIYNKKQPVTITITQGENEDYAEGTATFTFTPRERPDRSVPMQLVKTIYNEGTIEAGNKCAWEDSENGVRVGNTNVVVDDLIWEHAEKNFTIAFDGQPGRLSFEYKSAGGIWVVTGGETFGFHMWEVKESSDGSTWKSVWTAEEAQKEWTSVNEIPLSPTTRYIRFSFSGNYWGYFRNINISELVGYKYLRAEADGRYLSRGAKWGTQAIVDDFGMACRISNYTNDNTNFYTRFLFVDNQQYLYEADNHEMYTDDGTAANNYNLWKQNVIDGTILTFQSGNEYPGDSRKGQYITLDGDALALTADAAAATKWQMEDYTEHPAHILEILNREAAEAASHDFATDVTTLEKVRSRVEENDFERTDIAIPALTLGEQSGEYRSGVAGTNAIYDNEISDLQPGFYRLTVKAFSRISSADVAWACHTAGAGMESVLAYIYANDVKYPIQSLYHSYQVSPLEPTDELRGGYYYSTDLTSAGEAFDDAKRYLNDVYVYIEADPGKTTGTLRYGIKNPSYVPGAWLAFEEITLTRFARKEYIFNGESATGETTDWQMGGNWNRNTQPDYRHVVSVQHDLVIDEEVSVYSLVIENDKDGNPVTVTIAPTGGLTVGAGGVKNATRDNFILQAGTTGATKGQTGYLRVSPYTREPMPEATVELFSIAYTDYQLGKSSPLEWQYVGYPLKDEAKAKSIFDGWIYNWVESEGTWKNNRKKLTLEPFTGYATSQDYESEGLLIEFNGQLVDNTTQYVPLTYSEESPMSGWNAIANSFAAPIDIKKMMADIAEEDVEATVYLFNTGSTDQVKGEAGTYVIVPMALAGSKYGDVTYPSVIPSMQGFFVKVQRNTSLKLDYSKIVWGADYESTPNSPLRVKANNQSSSTSVLSVMLENNGQHERMQLIESEDFVTSFENGYDAHIMPRDFNIFAIEDETDYLAIDATNSIIGTRLGVRTGEETAYTITFSHLSDRDDLALLDAETNETIDINEGTAYTFFAEPNSMIEDRFEIVAREDAPAITTDIENVEKESKAHKFIKGDRLFILKNGVLYNAVGAVVR